MSRKHKYISLLNGAQGRNRTTDTRIFKICVLNKLLKASIN